ncbi:MAG: Na/Pi symporter [Firmicutes bacterium]|nr:Na/Pi symporter [Bacillota bacterium]
MQAGLIYLSSRRLVQALRSFSASHMRSFLVGLFTSALTQSSTAVSVITVGLVHSRLLNLSQAIAVILGANTGTTLTVQFMAVKPGVITLSLTAAGFAFLCSPLKATGKILTGIGMIFFGLDFLNQAVGSLQHAPWFAASLVHSTANPLLAIACATILTAFLHSSGAATGIVIALHSQKAITLEAAIALVLGNNIGTCFTALIASRIACAARR